MSNESRRTFLKELEYIEMVKRSGDIYSMNTRDINDRMFLTQAMDQISSTGLFMFSLCPDEVVAFVHHGKGTTIAEIAYGQAINLQIADMYFHGHFEKILHEIYKAVQIEFEKRCRFGSPFVSSESIPVPFGSDPMPSSYRNFLETDPYEKEETNEDYALIKPYKEQKLNYKNIEL